MAEVRGLSSNNNMIMNRNRATTSTSTSTSTSTAATSTATNYRDISPDSVILTFESHFSSLFSSSASASASVDRCSFASDAAVDSLSSDLSQLHLNGGPDLEIPSSNKTHTAVSYSKVDKAAKGQENKRVLHYDDVDDEYDSEIQPLDSARSSFSVALKECKQRRSRSEALQRKLDRRRTSSFDLNNSSSSGSNYVGSVMSSSPRLGVNVMRKASVSSRKLGNFPSPGTPNYRHGSVVMGGVSKGWSSERVPLPGSGNRRQVGASLLPLNNGKALPSKWEDAERWILSPVDGSARHSSYSSQQQQILRRPKSKSGPLGPPGVAYYSMYSPAVPMDDGHHMNGQIGGSPFLNGAMMADALSFRGLGTSGRGFSDCGEPCIARSVSVHGCTDLVCQSSIASSLDENADSGKDGATNVSRAVSRRDMATQMSPEGSRHSSPGRLSFSPSTPSNLPIIEVKRNSISSSKSEVRDVQIDERVTVTRWSKKYRHNKGVQDVDDWNMKAVESRSSLWEMSDSVKSISKVRRDEAKITAWENLQKAKAEAAIRKLEMKLEKKRSSSMDKIMKKLRSAQKKAQEMRNSVLANQPHQVSNTNNTAISIRRTRQIGSLSGCFTCHAF